MSHRWDLIIDLRDLPTSFMYGVGVTISHTGINLFLAHSERVKLHGHYYDLSKFAEKHPGVIKAAKNIPDATPLY